MKNFIVAFVVATCSVAFVTSATPVNKCSSGPAPISVTSGHCTQLPCVAEKNTLVNVTTEFNAVTNAKTLRSDIDIKLDGKTIMEGSDPELCSRLLEGSCPLTAGETITTSYSEQLFNAIPVSNNLEVQVTISDENNVIQECFVIPVQVVASKLARSTRSPARNKHRWSHLDE